MQSLSVFVLLLLGCATIIVDGQTASSPAAGDVLSVGGTVRIVWHGFTGATVNLTLVRANVAAAFGYEQVVYLDNSVVFNRSVVNTPNVASSSYDWTVPFALNTYALGNNYSIAVAGSPLTSASPYAFSPQFTLNRGSIRNQCDNQCM